MNQFKGSNQPYGGGAFQTQYNVSGGGLSSFEGDFLAGPDGMSQGGGFASTDNASYAEDSDINKIVALTPFSDHFAHTTGQGFSGDGISAPQPHPSMQHNAAQQFGFGQYGSQSQHSSVMPGQGQQPPH